MTKPARVSIVFFNEQSQQVQVCMVDQAEVQQCISREVARGSALNIPLRGDDSIAPITDQALHELGGLVMLNLGSRFPELRPRFQFRTANTMDWAAIDNRSKSDR
ncbi:hypothetical protein [Caballeronia sp. Sq4a]|uniref:hypothetical protein n=1 Tax=Caballeronia sp. Sq4a TaxID=2878152 RepID=UPI0020C16E3F|nr:hypothetical protein [Caballeronia sp. Sq4a]